MKVISFLAVLALLLINVCAQVPTNTTDIITPPPVQTNTSVIQPTGTAGTVFFPSDPNVVKGGPCQIIKVEGTVENSCCYQGFVTINKNCEKPLTNGKVRNPCQIGTLKCGRDESCLATYYPRNTGCFHAGRTARAGRKGRKAGKQNNKRAQGVKIRKGAPKQKANEFNTNGRCYGILQAEEASEKDPVNFPSNKVQRFCLTAKQINKRKRRYARFLSLQAQKKRNQPRRGKWNLL
jgi:hypothetical protein